MSILNRIISGAKGASRGGTGHTAGGRGTTPRTTGGTSGGPGGLASKAKKFLRKR